MRSDAFFVGRVGGLFHILLKLRWNQATMPRARWAWRPRDGTVRSGSLHGRGGRMERTMAPGEELETIVLAAREDLWTRLIPWYRRSHRVLPWRETSDPYAVWVSEVMLQQTQVRTVIPYFERFMARFPTVEALARAPLEEVLSLWKGLGYYSRARNLHRGAQAAVDRYQGNLPDDPRELQRLPGIGRYTAGAISSIAFGVRVPVLDGNVIRVLCRLFAIEEDPSGTRTRNRLWRMAELLVPEDDPGTFNQALMELGALICTPARADCLVCPVREPCAASRLPDPTALPVRPRKRARPEVRAVCLAVWNKKHDALLFGLRPTRGLLGGLWELPSGSAARDESVEEAARRISRQRLGRDLEPRIRPERITHLFTHLKLILEVASCDRPLEHLPEAGEVTGEVPEEGAGGGSGTVAFDVAYVAFRWVRHDAWSALPVGKATARVLAGLHQEASAGRAGTGTGPVR